LELCFNGKISFKIMDQNSTNISISKKYNILINILPWLCGFSLLAIITYRGCYSIIGVDTLHFIELAKASLNGKLIYRDLFEVNHPMPFYIVWIPVYLSSKISWLHEVFATISFINLLCLASIILTYKVMMLTDEYKNKYFKFIHIITLFYITFVLPTIDLHHITEIGQKSHLFIILFLPYLHSFLIDKKIRKSHPALMIASGMFAGIGLCVKIYFFIIAVILEIGLMLNKKSVSSVFRIETITISLVAILFLLSIILFVPEYITQIIPIAKFSYANFYPSSEQFWLKAILANSGKFILLLFFISIKSQFIRYKSLIKLAIIASIISIQFQFSKWAHTALPTIAFIFLFIAAILADIFQNTFEKFPKNQDKFTTEYVTNFFIALLTILFLLQPISNNSHQKIKSNYYTSNNIDYFIELSHKYTDKGGAHFLTASYEPNLHSWIYGDFALQTYFYSAYVIDGLERYYKKHKERLSNQKREEFNKVKTKVIDRITHDLIEQKPAIVVVQRGLSVPEYLISNNSDRKSKKTLNLLMEVNYLEYLSDNLDFKTFWEQQYILKEIIETKNPKKIGPIFEVYLRKDLKNL